jgi:5'-3' exonuclease
LIHQLRPNRVVVGWDGIEAGINKYDFYPPWKIHKKEESEKIQRLIREGNLAPINDKEEHEQSILRQKIKIQHMLENCFVRQLYSDTAEACDLIAAYTIQSDDESDEVYIYSREHEFYQLISSNVSVVIPSKDVITLENYTEKVGYNLGNELMLRCFVGNESETVPGIKGLSRNRLVKYFPRLKDEKISYNEMCEYAEVEIEKNKIQTYELILGAKDILLRNSKVLNLKNPFLSQEGAYIIHQMLHLPLSEDRNINEAKSYFEIDGYADYINESIDDFMSVFYSLMVSEREYRKIYNTIKT